MRCTRANLQAIRVEADLVLCQPPGESDKNPRFERVPRGTAAPGFAAANVVEWIATTSRIFSGYESGHPGRSAAFSEFGKRYFVLPESDVRLVAADSRAMTILSLELSSVRIRVQND
jgi:hypothetical protein